MKTLQDLIEKTKDKISEEELTTEYNRLKTEVQETFKGTPEELDQRTLHRTILFFKRHQRSPAKLFEGMILGISRVRDMSEFQIRQALKLYEENPQKAVTDKIVIVVNDKPIPLDTREKFASGKSNFNYGKPLPEHNYLRTVYGVVKKGTDNPMWFRLNINGEKALQEDIPLFKSVQFRALDRTQETDTQLNLNSSSTTAFVPSDIKLPPVDELLQTHGVNQVELANLNEWHTTNKDKTNDERIIITKGFVNHISDVYSSGNRMLVLDNVEDIDFVGVTCWMPNHIPLTISEGCEAYVIGIVNQASKKNDDGSYSDDLENVTINVLGVHTDEPMANPEDLTDKVLEDVKET